MRTDHRTLFVALTGCLAVFARAQSIGPLQESTDGGKTWHPEGSSTTQRYTPPPAPPPPTPEQIARQQATVKNEAGRNLYDAGDYPGAIAAFEAALLLQPNDPDLQHNLTAARNELKKERERRASAQRTVALKEKIRALRQQEDETDRTRQQQRQQERAADRAMSDIQFNGTGRAFIQLQQAAGEGNAAISSGPDENAASVTAGRPFDDRSNLKPAPLPRTPKIGGSILGTSVAQLRAKVPPARREEFDSKLAERDKLQAQYDVLDRRLLGGIEDANERLAASQEAGRLKSAVRTAEVELQEMVTVTLTPPKRKTVVPPPPVTGTP